MHEVVIHLNQRGGIYSAERLINGRYREITLRPEDLQIAPLGREIGERCKSWKECLAIGINPALLERISLEVFDKDRVDLIPCDGVRDPQILRIGQALWSEVQAECPSGRLYGESLAMALAMRLLSQYSESPRAVPDNTGGMPKRLLRRTLDYIEANLTGALRLSDLADNVNYESVLLLQTIQKKYGRSASSIRAASTYCQGKADAYRG
ncbi:MAG: hypothetical protein ACREP6_15355 [Candidatus Binataceae bacterium]